MAFRFGGLGLGLVLSGSGYDLTGRAHVRARAETGVRGVNPRSVGTRGRVGCGCSLRPCISCRDGRAEVVAVAPRSAAMPAPAPAPLMVDVSENDSSDGETESASDKSLASDTAAAPWQRSLLPRALSMLRPATLLVIGLLPGSGGRAHGPAGDQGGWTKVDAALYRPVSAESESSGPGPAGPDTPNTPGSPPPAAPTPGEVAAAAAAAGFERCICCCCCAADPMEPCIIELLPIEEPPPKDDPFTEPPPIDICDTCDTCDISSAITPPVAPVTEEHVEQDGGRWRLPRGRRGDWRDDTDDVSPIRMPTRVGGTGFSLNTA